MSLVMAHGRVTAALVVREMSARFGSKPGGYLWAILDPAAHIIMLTIIFQTLTRTPALGTSFPLFFATGYLAFQFYAATASYVNGSIKSNRSLLTYPNVAPIDTVAARYVLQLITTTLVVVIVLTAIHMTLRIPEPISFPALIEAAGLASLMGLGMALMNTVLFLRYPVWEKIYAIIHRPLFMISGIFFLPDAIPHPYRDIVLLNPLVHVTMLFRTGFYPAYRAAGLDLAYLYGCSFALFFAGFALFTLSSAVLRAE